MLGSIQIWCNVGVLPAGPPEKLLKLGWRLIQFEASMYKMTKQILGRLLLVAAAMTQPKFLCVSRRGG